MAVAALIGDAISPGFVWLAAASFAIGPFATVAQQIVPLAVHLAPPAERGEVLGMATGGILIGILLASTISSALSDLWGRVLVRRGDDSFDWCRVYALEPTVRSRLNTIFMAIMLAGGAVGAGIGGAT